MERALYCEDRRSKFPKYNKKLPQWSHGLFCHYREAVSDLTTARRWTRTGIGGGVVLFVKDFSLIFNQIYLVCKSRTAFRKWTHLDLWQSTSWMCQQGFSITPIIWTQRHSHFRHVFKNTLFWGKVDIQIVTRYKLSKFSLFSSQK